MNRLTHVEAQRVMAVFEQILEKAQLISYFSRELITSLPEDILEVIDAETLAAVKYQKTLEDQYAELIAKKAPQGSQDLKDVGEKLKLSTLNLCRYLSKNPVLIEKLKQYQVGGRNTSWKALLKNTTELKDLTFQRLSVTVEEEKSKQDYLSDLQQKEQKASQELKTLQTQLGELRAKHDKEVAQKNNIISRLKGEIMEIKSNAATEAKVLGQDTLSNQTRDTLTHQEMDTAQVEQLQKLQQQLDDKIKTDKKVEQNMRKKKLKTEKEVENWIHKYDHEMTDKANEIENLTNEYEQIKKELEELSIKYKEICKEKDEILEEERKVQDEQMKEAEKIRHLSHSAAVIQRWWRERHRHLMELRRSRRLKSQHSKKATATGSRPAVKTTRPSSSTSTEKDRSSKPSSAASSSRASLTPKRTARSR